MNENIKTEEIDGVLILSPSGKLTLREGTDLREKVRGMANTKVVVDMSLVLRIDSAGLGTMLQLLKDVEAAGGVLKLCAMTRIVLNVFQLTRLHHIFDIYNSTGEALQAFGQPSPRKLPLD